MRNHLLWSVPLLALAFACGGGGGATPPTDPCAGVERECTTNSECAAGEACSECGTCETSTSNACTYTAQCPEGQLCEGGECVPGGCTGDADCEADEVCRSLTRTCEVRDCARDGCPGDLRCRTEDNSCVECLSHSNCLDVKAPYCESASGSCVGCRGDEECVGHRDGPICDMTRKFCVTCLSDAECGGEAPRCNVESGQCAQCLDDTDCASNSFCREDGTCDPGPMDGEACRDDGTCAEGFTCHGEERICRAACDPYSPSCTNGTICIPWDGAGKVVIVNGSPAGACLADDGGANVGRGCDDQAECRDDLFCYLDSPTAGRCRRFCDFESATPGCGTNEVCLRLPLGGRGEEVGVCSPNSSYLAECGRDADCAFNQGCQPMPDGLGGLEGRCAWSPTGGKAAVSACTADSDCRSGLCVHPTGNTGGFCYGACEDNTACGAAAVCGTVEVPGGTIAGCQPTCASDAGCVDFGAATCRTFLSEGSWTGICSAPVGMGALGTSCLTDVECASGKCQTNGRPGFAATAGFCVAPCDLSDECGDGLACRDTAFRTTPMNEDPAYDSINVCWGENCSHDSECPDAFSCQLDLEPTAPESNKRLACLPSYGALGGGQPCTGGNTCASGTCFSGGGQPTWYTMEDCSTSGWDEDTDGLANCADPDCQMTSTCRTGGENCTNGTDDDGDSLIDCADPACSRNKSCAESCTNGSDDNGNGLIDCADPTCAYQQACGSQMCFAACRSDADCAPGTECDGFKFGAATTETNTCLPIDYRWP